MTLPKYPSYRDSGVHWLGQVPEHWVLTRFKNALSLKQETVGVRANDFLLLSLTLQGVIPRDLENPQGKFPASFETYQAVEDGDLVFCLFDVEETPRTVGISRHRGMVTGAYTVTQAKNGVVLEYLYYYYYARDQYKAWRMFYTGLRNVIRWDNFCDIPCLLPPKDEQVAIAKFLDRETAKIDALIKEQERLIALLTEKRHATISHVVTKGLNPSAPMKDSGVAWLGDVPSHWDVATFQRYVYVQEGQVNPEEEPYRSMVLIAPNHVESGTGRLLYLETAQEQSAESGKYLCKSGDVIYSKIRPALRKVCIAPEDCLCSADMYPLRGTSTLSNSFLKWFMLSEPFSAFAVLESERVAMPKINRESLKAVWLPIPTPQEQEAIDFFLVTETAKLDALKDEAGQAIKLLAERRSALIAAAVTGQIDVRESKLQAAVESPEALAA
jgi:type I restriction enzyme S subunit